MSKDESDKGAIAGKRHFATTHWSMVAAAGDVIYSLGVVFYEMLTGELPIGRFEPPSQKVHIDVRLDEVVLRSLEATPDRRYQHASDVKTDVESIVGDGDTQFQVATQVMAEFKSSVRDRLKIPAIGLPAAGSVNLIAAVAIALVPVWAPVLFSTNPEGFKEMTVRSIVIALCSFASGILLLIGAARMFDLQNWGMAGVAAFGAILPVTVGFPIGLPFGIWALLVLSRRDVRSAFADWDMESEPNQLPKGLASAVGGTMVAGMIVGLTLGAALDRDNLGVYMVLGMVFGLLLGAVIDSNNRRKSQD